MGRETRRSTAQLSYSSPLITALYRELSLDYLPAISDLSDALARGLGNAITGNVLGVLTDNIPVLIVIPVLKRLID